MSVANDSLAVASWKEALTTHEANQFLAWFADIAKQASGSGIQIDLSKSGRIDSAGIAALVAAKAKHHNSVVEYTGLPSAIIDLADFYGISDMIGTNSK